MTTKTVSIALGMMLMAAGSAHASRLDERDAQAPRSGRSVEALRGAAEEIQAPRGQDIQAPRSDRAQDIQAPRDQEIQAPRGLSTRE
jgi:hypothetical protein